MKILLLNECIYPDSIGGVEKRNNDLAAALARRGHEVTIAGFGRGPSMLPQGVTVEPFGDLVGLYGGGGKRSTRHALRFASRMMRLDVDRFDLVETSNIPFVHLFPLALRCRTSGVPLLVTWYEFWGPYWKEYLGRSRAPVYRLTEWLAAQTGDRAIAAGEFTANRLRARRLGHAGVDIVPCGVDLAAMRTAALQVSTAHGPQVIYAGRLIPEKRVELLVRAAGLLRSSGNAPRVVIYGEGPDRPRLESLAAALAPGMVEFRGHVESEKEIWRAIAASKIAVQPSAREGFGIFPLEAMALGKPVVYCAGRENAIPELVRDGIEGIAAQPDAESVAAAMNRLLSDALFYQSMSGRAEKRADTYDWSSVAEQFENVAQNLVSRSREREKRVSTEGHMHDTVDGAQRVESGSTLTGAAEVQDRHHLPDL